MLHAVSYPHAKRREPGTCVTHSAERPAHKPAWPPDSHSLTRFFRRKLLERGFSRMLDLVEPPVNRGYRGRDYYKVPARVTLSMSMRDCCSWSKSGRLPSPLHLGSRQDQSQAPAAPILNQCSTDCVRVSPGVGQNSPITRGLSGGERVGRLSWALSGPDIRSG